MKLTGVSFVVGCLVLGTAIVAPKVLTDGGKLVTAKAHEGFVYLDNARLDGVREAATATATAVAESLTPAFDRQALASEKLASTQSESIAEVTRAIREAAAKNSGKPVEVRVVVDNGDNRFRERAYRGYTPSTYHGYPNRAGR